MWPRSSDAILNIINNMSSKKKIGSNKKPELRISISRWSDSQRGYRITDALFSKMFSGLKVKVVSREDDIIGMEPGVIFRFFAYSIYSFLNGTLHLGDINKHEQNIHHKYFTYEGCYNNSSVWKKIVWTGSENWTYNAYVLNDEILIKCEDDSAFDRYVSNHKLMQQYCKQII